MTRPSTAPVNVTTPTIIPIMGPRPRGGREAPLLAGTTAFEDDVSVGGGAARVSDVVTFLELISLAIWVFTVVGISAVVDKCELLM